jgi:hypothetical protein
MGAEPRRELTLILGRARAGGAGVPPGRCATDHRQDQGPVSERRAPIRPWPCTKDRMSPRVEFPYNWRKNATNCFLSSPVNRVSRIRLKNPTVSSKVSSRPSWK